MRTDKELIKNFSFYKGGITSIVPADNAMNIERLAKGITSEHYKSVTEEYRAKKNEAVKRGFDYVTFSGTFTRRGSVNLIKYSGLIALDFDDINPIEAKEKILASDVEPVMIFTSPSGNGLKVIVNATNESEHLQNFEMYRTYFKSIGLDVDKSGKDIGRACFVCYDPECYINLDAKFKVVADVDLQRKSGNGSSGAGNDDVLKVYETANAIKSSGLNIAPDYDSYLSLAFSLASLGESGRSAFHAVCSASEKYNQKDADAKFTECLKSGSGSVGLGTFFKLAKDAGFRQERKVIEQAPQVRKEKKGKDKRDFNSLSTKADTEKPCELIQDLIEFGGMPEFREWLKTFDFKNLEQIEYAIKKFVAVVTSDPHLNNKANRDAMPTKKYIFNQMNSIMNRADALDKYSLAIAGELWGGYFSRHKLNQRTKEMFSAEPNQSEYESAVKDIKDIWGFSDLDIEKFRFFVAMVKDNEFPPTLRRMIYLWGEKNQTGKTTLASTIICILNGEKDIKNIADFSSFLSVEMQIQNYAVPKISECNAVLMDEMFYHDMSKMYSSFKAFMTSEDGTARLPYGQTFRWYGKPNFFATSNYPLTGFIKDQQDRRYLEIRIEEVPKQASFEKIYDVWQRFCINATRPTEYNSWKEWNDAIAPDAEVKGEIYQILEDYITDLQNGELFGYIKDKYNLNSELNKTANQNRITLTYFIKFFEEKRIDTRRQRQWIEKAVIAVFGERYKGSNYWLLSDLHERVKEIEQGSFEPTNPGVSDITFTLSNDDATELPF